MKTKMIWSQWVWLLGILGWTLFGCAKTETRAPQAVLDTPAHHVLKAEDLIKAQKWSLARQQFELALELQPNYAPAMAGKALVIAHETTLPGRSKKENEPATKEALDLFDDAQSAAQNPREKAQVEIYGIRLQTKLKSGNDWWEKAEKHYNKAVEIQEDHLDLHNFRAEPHFYMARAYREAQKFRKAQQAYTKVLELNLSLTREANEELETVQKVARAEPGSLHGQRVAGLEAITRADMAALLIEELHLETLYQRSGVQYDQKYRSPEKNFETEERRKIPVATDLEKHPLRTDIETILGLKVRGLEADPQHLFHPHQSITRAEYALMLEDILIKVTQDKALARRFIGESSPWLDVRADAFYYNAARTLVSRNMMTVWNKVRGEFGPQQPVSGADALLGLRVLKDELNSYVRRPQS